MAALPLHTLPTESDGFLSVPDIGMIGHGVIVRAQFDLSAFDLGLFAKLEITRPASLDQAIPKRLAEFLAGRILARIAQEALGHDPATIAIGENRAPVWPANLTGSISHARGHCACFVQDAAYGHVGIDIDLVTKDQALKAILRMVINPTERALLDAAPLPLDLSATLVFSAKETLFKALFPTVERHFGFPSAVLQAAPTNGILQLYLTEGLHPSLPAGTVFDIAYDCDGIHVCTWLIHAPV